MPAAQITGTAPVCRCYPGYTSHLIGPTACDPPISRDWNVSDGSQLAQRLCTQYSRYLELLQQVCCMCDRCGLALPLLAASQNECMLDEPASLLAQALVCMMWQSSCHSLCKACKQQCTEGTTWCCVNNPCPQCRAVVPAGAVGCCAGPHAVPGCLQAAGCIPV
jgi:hypothetical protein